MPQLIGLKPIGIVRHLGARSDDSVRPGAGTCIEIFPQFAEGLSGIEGNSHVVVMGWLHHARRDQLQVLRPDYETGGESETCRGVFACRSPVRPNPISITTVRLLKVANNLLYTDWLDLEEGTRIVDIKPHAAGFDGVFSARNLRELSPLPSRRMGPLLRGMLREAEHFHGERCRGVALGVRVMSEAMRRFGIGQKDAGLVIGVGNDGCLADTLQALSGASLGNRRLLVNCDGMFSLRYGSRGLRFKVRPVALPFSELLRADIAAIVDIEGLDP